MKTTIDRVITDENKNILFTDKNPAIVEVKNTHEMGESTNLEIIENALQSVKSDMVAIKSVVQEMMLYLSEKPKIHYRLSTEEPPTFVDEGDIMIHVDTKKTHISHGGVCGTNNKKE